MDAFLHDLRYAVRLLLKSPGFSAVAIITLALGIGATTAMFTVVNGVILSPLPFSDPDRLVTIKESIPKLSPTPLSTVPAPDVLTYRHESSAFTDVAGYQEETMDMTGHGEPRKIQAARITANLFPVLGVAPLAGRNIASDEDRPGSQKVVLLSYQMWHTLFAGDAGAIDKTILLDRQPYTVIGIMPSSFVFPIEAQKEPVQLWMPMAFTDEERKSIGDNFDFNIVARLKPGLSVPQSQADVERVAQMIRDQYPADVKNQFEMHGVVVGLRESALGNYRAPLLIMMLTVIFVLLIAIANVANLLLAKGTARQRELSIRIALGAGARRVVSQLISESIVLGVIGGAVGLLIAALGTTALISTIPANIPRLHSIAMDWRVFLFAFGISVFSGIVFGAAPAFFALRVNVNDGLKEGGRSGMQGRQHRYLRTGFVVAQFSLALMLLIGAGLLIRSFRHVLEVDPGFQPANVISASVSLPSTSYKEPAQKRAFHLELMRRLQTPGIEAVGAATDLPLESNWTKIFSIEGQVPPPGAGLNMDSHSIVLADYFRALGIPLIRGRLFTEADDQKSTRVIIINKTLADRYFHGQNPIGHRLKWGPPESESPWLTIIGVVGDVKDFELEKDARAHTYENYRQYPSLSDVRVVIRARNDLPSAISALQSAVHSLDPQLPITEIRTMDQVMTESTSQRRFYLILVIVFAATAIVLAAVGLYGVVSYAVEQRTREIGIRMTLGATQSNVLNMLLRWALLLVVVGIAVGTLGAFAVTRLLTGFLFNTKPNDPLTFVGVALMLGTVALLASYIPAKRTTKVDPMVALRYE